MTTYTILRSIFIPRAYRKIARCEGLENVPEQGPFLLAANHVSWLDPVYITAAVCKRNRGRLLFLSATAKHRWTQAVIPIDRKNPSGCLEEAMRHLQHGHAVGLFPRGDQRKSTPSGKTGVARLARWSGLPVIPTAICSTVAGHTVTALRDYFFGGRDISLAFGPPIRFAQQTIVSPEELHADMARIEGAIAELLQHFS
ncbi:MAG: lysophospholipid acyltransferase family protein [bacterium]